MPGTKIPCAVLKVKKLSFDQSGTTVTTATLRYSKNKKKKTLPKHKETRTNQQKKALIGVYYRSIINLATKIALLQKRNGS